MHPSGRTRTRQFPPQDRRQGKSDQIVQRPSCQIGIDQIAIDLARMFHGIKYRFLRDGVEHHPLDRLVLQQFLVVENLQNMPGNCLTLAVRVGCEDQFVSILDCLGDVSEPGLCLCIHCPGHGEIIIRQNRTVLGWQVAHMAIGGQNGEVLPQILIDGFRFGGRLDNN